MNKDFKKIKQIKIGLLENQIESLQKISKGNLMSVSLLLRSIVGQFLRTHYEKHPKRGDE